MWINNVHFFLQLKEHKGTHQLSPAKISTNSTCVYMNRACCYSQPRKDHDVCVIFTGSGSRNFTHLHTLGMIIFTSLLISRLFNAHVFMNKSEYKKFGRIGPKLCLYLKWQWASRSPLKHILKFWREVQEVRKSSLPLQTMGMKEKILFHEVRKSSLPLFNWLLSFVRHTWGISAPKWFIIIEMYWPF